MLVLGLPGRWGGVGEGAYLCNQDDDDQPQANVAAVDAADGLEGDLVQGVAVVGPGLAEPDVGEADAAPGEQGGQAGKREQPVKDGRAVGVEVDKGEQAEGDDDADAEERTARAVDVGEDLGRVPLLRERRQRARAAVHGRHANGQHRDEDDDVHERVEAAKPSILANQHERRRVDVGVRVRGAQETAVVVGDQQADEEEAQDVEAVGSGGVSKREEPHRRATIKTHRVIRQNTCLMAPGIDLTGLRASAAARPTSSVPLKAKAAVTKTLQKPRKPLAKAPGSYHRRAPQ